MADIESVTAEIRQGKKIDRRRNHRAKIQWPALFHRAAIIILLPAESSILAFLQSAEAFETIGLKPF